MDVVSDREFSDRKLVTALASCTLDVAIAKLDCVQLLAHMHASNSSNQCSQATKIQLLCTQTETVAVGYVHSNTLSTCTIWECARLTHHHQMVQKVCLGQGLHRPCSQDFTMAAVYLVLQIALSRQKVVLIHSPINNFIDCAKQFANFGY